MVELRYRRNSSAAVQRARRTKRERRNKAFGRSVADRSALKRVRSHVRSRAVLVVAPCCSAHARTPRDGGAGPLGRHALQSPGASNNTYHTTQRRHTALSHNVGKCVTHRAPEGAVGLKE
jgi:hypothetical protein